MLILPNNIMFMFNYNEFVAARIKELRIKKGIMQKSVSGYISLSPNAYSRIENGYTQITIQNLFLIAECIGVKVEEILDVGNNVLNNNGLNLEELKSRGTVYISLSAKEFNEIYTILENQKNRGE